MRSDLSKRRYGAVCALGWILLIAGCGTKLATVEGNVTWEGKPVDEGSISFAPADGKGPTLGGVIKNGQYQLVGKSWVTPGKKIVTITAVRKTGKQIEAGPPAPPGTMVDDLETVTVTHTCDISEGKANQKDFEVKPPPKP